MGVKKAVRMSPKSQSWSPCANGLTNLLNVKKHLNAFEKKIFQPKIKNCRVKWLYRNNRSFHLWFELYSIFINSTCYYIDVTESSWYEQGLGLPDSALHCFVDKEDSDSYLFFFMYFFLTLPPLPEFPWVWSSAGYSVCPLTP